MPTIIYQEKSQNSWQFNITDLSRSVLQQFTGRSTNRRGFQESNWTISCWKQRVMRWNTTASSSKMPKLCCEEEQEKQRQRRRLALKLDHRHEDDAQQLLQASTEPKAATTTTGRRSKITDGEVASAVTVHRNYRIATRQISQITPKFS